MANVFNYLLDPVLCANADQRAALGFGPCRNVPGIPCPICKIVQYCDETCRSMDWERHQHICISPLMKRDFTPNWVIERRMPKFMLPNSTGNFGKITYLWGNMPAINILKGLGSQPSSKSTVDREIDLLFAASGDMRNVIKTVVEGIPRGHSSRCSVVINDMEFRVVARNIIFLFIACIMSPEEAAPMILHLWYSAIIPFEMLRKLQIDVLPHITRVCDSIKGMPDAEIHAETFHFGGRKSLRLELQKSEWDRLPSFFHVPPGLSVDEAQTLRGDIMMSKFRTDHLHLAFSNQIPQVRVAESKFREDGHLLPYGVSRVGFNTPNPTFFHDYTWPMPDSAIPFAGWNCFDYLDPPGNRKTVAASNDFTGILYFYIMDMILRFCKDVNILDIHFHLLNFNLQDLPAYLKPSQFDCIEVSNACDRVYGGPKPVINSLSPLLKPKSVNPKATLLMLFMNVTYEAERKHTRGTKQRRFEEALPLMERFMTMPTIPEGSNLSSIVHGANAMYNPETIKFVANLPRFVGDFDLDFEEFLEDVDMDRLLRESNMGMRESQLIIKPRPFRITRETRGDVFNLMSGNMPAGFERYIEIERL